jgi:hypothetical protein
MSIINALCKDVQKVRETYQGLGVVASFFSWFQGRATFFAIIFTVCGLIGFFKRIDLGSYSLFVASILTGVVGHSLKEDYFEMRRNRDEQSTTITTIPTPPADPTTTVVTPSPIPERTQQ